MIRVNLLPDLVLDRRREARTKRLATLGLGAWVGLLLLVTVGAIIFNGVQSQRLAASQKLYAETNDRVNSEENVAFRTEALEVQTSLKALNQLFTSQRRLSVVNSRIAALTPKSARVKQITITEDNRIEITGSAVSYAEAGKMLVALKEASPEGNGIKFDSVIFNGANASSDGVAFSISAQYTYLKPVEAPSQ